MVIADKRHWYIIRDNTDSSEDEIGEFPKERRAQLRHRLRRYH